LADFENIYISTFSDPQAAIAHCLSNRVDLLIVDYMMPELNGIDVIKTLRVSDDYRLVPIIMITAERDRNILIQAIEAGATEFIAKPFDTVELRARVGNLLELRRSHVELAKQTTKLVDEVAKATKKLAEREEEIIWRLARAIEYRDGDTGDHISRVAHISQIIARDIGLSNDDCRMIYLAAPLHDVGKIGISDNILLKPGKLTLEERAEMEKHVEIGVGILGNGTSNLLQVAEAIAAGHHEKWDGTGYPKGLSGADIPIEARIVSVADVFDALCSERPYKKRWTLEDARYFIAQQSGTHFDPACVAAFQRQWQQISGLMGGVVLETLESPPLEAEMADYASLLSVRAKMTEKA
jgi:putative two-component system response regulator